MTLQRSNQVSDSSEALKVLSFLIPLGLIGIIIYSLQSWDLTLITSVFGVVSMLAGASLLLGGFVGFLFGIPRTLQKDMRPPTDAEKRADESGNNGVAYQANTNLEQISDWLTKIMIGVGLTQLTNLPGKLQQLTDYVSIGLGNASGSRPFTLFVILYFAVCGFLFGYLWTRLFLAGEFKKADMNVSVLLAQSIATLDAVEPKLNESDKEPFKEFRQEVENQLASLLPDNKSGQQLEKYAQDYERVRKVMSWGRERTVQMGTILAQVRALSQKANYKPEIIKKLFDTGADGNRIVALGLMQVFRYPQLVDIVLDSMRDPRSAFEQYQALRIIENMVASLNENNKQQLLEILNDQRSGQPGKLITKDSDRWGISERILIQLNM